MIAQYVAKYNQHLQIALDRAAPQILPRWVLWTVSLLVYVLRVWFLKGFYIVTYGLGIYNLNLLLGFITPQVDPEQATDGPALPTKSDQEFKPFVRRLPEFKFWCVCCWWAGWCLHHHHHHHHKQQGLSVVPAVRLLNRTRSTGLAAASAPRAHAAAATHTMRPAVPPACVLLAAHAGGRRSSRYG